MALTENFSSAVRALRSELGSSPTLTAEHWMSNSDLVNQGPVQRQWRAAGAFTGLRVTLGQKAGLTIQSLFLSTALPAIRWPAQT